MASESREDGVGSESFSFFLVTGRASEYPINPNSLTDNRSLEQSVVIARQRSRNAKQLPFRMRGPVQLVFLCGNFGLLIASASTISR
jgi:hypothetical protein